MMSFICAVVNCIPIVAMVPSPIRHTSVTPPNYINSFFQMSIPEKFATLSDYLIHKYKQLPPRGKELKIGKHLFFIEEIGEEFIERVRIKKLK